MTSIILDFLAFLKEKAKTKQNVLKDTISSFKDHSQPAKLKDKESAEKDKTLAKLDKKRAKMDKKRAERHREIEQYKIILAAFDKLYENDPNLAASKRFRELQCDGWLDLWEKNKWIEFFGKKMSNSK